MWEVYTWRGETIKDIDAWAKERGERMIRYRLTRRTPYGPEVSEGRMPESFWKSLMFRGDETYEELNAN